MTRRYHLEHRSSALRRTRITDQDLAIIAALPLQPAPSRTALEAMPDELRPILDPFPFRRDVEAGHALRVNRGLDRLVYTANQVDADSLRAAAFRAGWTETAPDVYQLDSLAVLLIRTAGTPNAALVVDGLAACSRYNAQHLDDPTAILWPNVQPQRPEPPAWPALL